MKGGEKGEGETGRSKEPRHSLYNEEETAGLLPSTPGEPVLPIIAAPRRPRDSPSSSHATRTSRDRPGPGPVLDAPAAAATHTVHQLRPPRTRARLSPSSLSPSLPFPPVPLLLSIQPGFSLSSSARFSRSFSDMVLSFLLS